MAIFSSAILINTSDSNKSILKDHCCWEWNYIKIKQTISEIYPRNQNKNPTCFVYTKSPYLGFINTSVLYHIPALIIRKFISGEEEMPKTSLSWVNVNISCHISAFFFKIKFIPWNCQHSPIGSWENKGGNFIMTILFFSLQVHKNYCCSTFMQF